MSVSYFKKKKQSDYCHQGANQNQNKNAN